MSPPQQTPRGPAPSKVTLVGAGFVGATCAYTLMARGLAAEIVLLDVKREKAHGEAMDISHALSFGQPARIWAGDYADAAGSDIVVVTAGAAQAAGQSRLSLAQTNVELLRQILPQVEAVAPEAILFLVTNPVDVLTYVAQRLSSYPPQRVIGSGTILDTSRFRFELARHCGVDPRNVHAYIIGEHGDSEVPVWSLANLAGMRLHEYCPLCGRNCPRGQLDELFERARTAAYRIIECKGATYFAIAMGVARLVEAILRDEHTVLTVSTLIEGYCGIRDVCLSLPTILHRGGVLKTVPLVLANDEEAALRRSAQTLRGVLRSVGF